MFNQPAVLNRRIFVKASFESHTKARSRHRISRIYQQPTANNQQRRIMPTLIFTKFTASSVSPVSYSYSCPSSSSSSSSSSRSRSAIEFLKALVRDEFECSICLEHLAETHVNPECLHRFCGHCIKESLRKCNHECPSCRVHIPTKRTLREDTQFDDIVSVLMLLFNTCKMTDFTRSPLTHHTIDSSLIIDHCALFQVHSVIRAIDTLEQQEDGSVQKAIDILNSAIMKDFQCSICLEQLTLTTTANTNDTHIDTHIDTRVNPECLHRVCGNCIASQLKSHNECAACSSYVHNHTNHNPSTSSSTSSSSSSSSSSKRTLRKDKQFDNIVSASTVLVVISCHGMSWLRTHARTHARNLFA